MSRQLQLPWLVSLTYTHSPFHGRLRPRSRLCSPILSCPPWKASTSKRSDSWFHCKRKRGMHLLSSPLHCLLLMCRTKRIPKRRPSTPCTLIKDQLAPPSPRCAHLMMQTARALLWVQQRTSGTIARQGTHDVAVVRIRSDRGDGRGGRGAGGDKCVGGGKPRG